MPTRGRTSTSDKASARRPSRSALVRQDLVEQGLGLVLVRLLSESQLAHENLPGLGQHALLTGRQPALAITPPAIPDHLGHFIDITRSELLQVGLLPARPVRPR